MILGSPTSSPLHESWKSRFPGVDLDSAFESDENDGSKDVTVEAGLAPVSSVDYDIELYNAFHTEDITFGPSSRVTLPSRWTPLRPHEKQIRFLNSAVRFNLVHSGRRGGKSEIMKRRGLAKAIGRRRFDLGYYLFTAPTHSQAKRIFWRDLKRFTPKELLSKEISESELEIELLNGAILKVLGLDVPERVEGIPIDYIGVDETGNCKESAWRENIRPALADRNGEADLGGTPEGRNWYWELRNEALGLEDWAVHHWPSRDILPPDEILAASRELDQRTLDQEYGGEFVEYGSRAYYTFSIALHASRPVPYNPALDLIFCFDFNVAPGVAAVLQEFPEGAGLVAYTGVVGEVYIPENSNTVLVCRKLVEDWHSHQGLVFCYGDATGGAKGSAKIAGSDWDLIKQILTPVFGHRLRLSVPSHNPLEKIRVNSVTSRLLSSAGDVRLRVDPKKAPHVVRDFDRVSVLEGSAGELDKDADPTLTHISDAIGYYVVRKWPLRTRTTVTEGF